MIARTRRSLALAALMSTAALLATPAALAQDLEQRVNNLERKLDALLDLMQQQMQANPAVPAQAPHSAAATSSVASAPVAVPESIRMGQLYLDVHTMPYKADDSYYMEASKIEAKPNGIAVGSVTVEPSGRFNYGEFVGDPALAPFARANALVQTVWSGVLKIEKTGSHAFQLSVGKEEGRDGAKSCRASLKVEEKPIVTAIISNAGGWDQVYSTEQGAISLQPGFYDFSVYMACMRDSRMDVFERYGATLLMAAPGDRVAKPIPAQLFGIRE
ncbi:hypothetical protein [Pannonibacter sp.]|uniref:hypothetical protein n=1 Tax=Pannonibacter sp. TaxID=1906786 RepID=UPI003F7007E4